MSTVTVFTVKQVALIDGRLYTYGGFGEYLAALRSRFDAIILACQVRYRDEVPVGWFEISLGGISVIGLPSYGREDECLRILPRLFMACRSIAKNADIVNARVPDYTGICGAFWAVWYNKKLFVNIVDDWWQRRWSPATRLRGLLRIGLQVHFAIYCFFEWVLCRRTLIFPQGASLQLRYASNMRAVGLVSTAHRLADVVGSPNRRTESCIRFIAIGRLVTVKGQRDLILAVKEFRERGGVCTLLLVGEGPDRTELESLVVALGLEDVIDFSGQLSREKLFGALDGADVLLHAAKGEGTPKVLLEAMARGVPVVAFDIGGVSSVVINNVNGVLLEPAGQNLLVQSMIRLACDEEFRFRLGCNAIKTARMHTTEEVWGRMLSVVEQNLLSGTR